MQKLHGCYVNLVGDKVSGTSYLWTIGNNETKDLNHDQRRI